MNFKKIISGLLVGCTVFSAVALTGCNKEKGPVYSKRTNVYAETVLTVPEAVDWIQYCTVDADRYYLSYTKMVEVEVDYTGGGFEDNIAVPYTMEVATESVDVNVPETEEDFLIDDDMIVEVDTDVEEEYPIDGPYTEIRYQNWFYSNTFDGTDPVDFYVDLDSLGGYIQNMFTDGKGNFYVLYNIWEYTDDGMGYTTYKMIHIDGRDGTVLGTEDLGEILSAADVDTTDMYINDVVWGSNNTLILTLQTNLYVIDMNTKTVANTYDCGNWIERMVVDGDTVYYTTYTENGTYSVFGVNLLTGENSRYDSETLQSVANYGCCGTSDGVIYFQSSGGVSYWDSKNDTAGEFMNYLNSDIDNSNIYNVEVLPDGRIFYYGSVWENDTNKVLASVLTRIPDEELKEEIIITVASVYNNYELRRAAIQFNKQNTGVRVTMKDYSQYNNEENEYTGAVTQLNADITMGNVPDILLIDSELPVESYFNKDVFVDLNQYIDDPEVGLNRDEYYENVLNLTNVNGELYTLIPRFYLKSLAAKTKYVGEESGWTMAEMLSTIQKMPEGMEAFSYDYDRALIQEMLIETCSNTFVDWENTRTNFDSQEFIDLIEFIKSCPEKSLNTQHNESIDYDNYDYQEEEEYWNNYTMRYYREQALFRDANIYDLNEITYLLQEFADDITLIGYPTEDEGSSGAVIVPQLEMGICTASPNHDSSWSFLRFLMEDKSTLESMYGLSINKVFMENKLAQSEELYADYYYEYTDEDWAWYEENYSAEYVEYLKNSRTKYKLEYGQMVLDCVKKATMVYRSDSNLSKIINEELSYFYGGTRDAATTANVINNITNLYVTQNS